MQLKRYNYTVRLADGTDLIPIKTEGSCQLMADSEKRIGPSGFYAWHRQGDIFKKGYDGSRPHRLRYLTQADFDKFNGWEDLREYEALATGDIRFLGRGGTFDVDDLSDDLEYTFIRRSNQNVGLLMYKRWWDYSNRECYFYSRPKRFKWITDMAPTAEDDHIVAIYDSAKARNLRSRDVSSVVRFALPWAEESDVTHFSEENPAPSPYDQKGASSEN